MPSHNTNFDCHAHISLKVMLGGTSNDNRKDCWFEIESPALDIVSGGVISSQSSLKQMRRGNVQLAIAPLYSLEHAFSKNFLLSSFIPKIEKALSKPFLQLIKKDEVSPYKLIKEELALIRKSQNSEMKVIDSLSEFDPNKINIIVAMEGLHSFQDTHLGKRSDLVASILKNLKEFIIQNRILYTGIPHLTRNAMCTHCYGMKLISDKEFIPEGGGLTEEAKKAVDICYSRVGFSNKYTFIDIKHMSLAARLQLYRHREQNMYTHIPIIASHFACNGNSYNNIRIFKPKLSSKYANTMEIKYHTTYSDVIYKYPTSPIPEFVKFNPWSLNLYNEEIFKIIESNGLIGIILDLRVLGSSGKDFGTTNPEGIEYMSLESYEWLKAQNRFNISATEEIEEDDEEDIDLDTIVGSKDAMHFFASILQVVKVYYDRFTNLKGWDHVCVGTDADGLIQPIKDFTNASDFNILRDELVAIFDAERQREKFRKYFGSIPSEDLAHKVFYSNGNRFINTWL